MIEIGAVLDEKVTHVEPYGVYLKHGEETILVLAPEVSWQGGDIREKVHVGDTVRVKILRLNYRTGENLGSIKRLQQDQNPYRRLSRLPRGTVLRGWVAGESPNNITVHLSDDVWGHISKLGLKQTLKIGDEVAVTIAYLDVEEGKIDFALAELATSSSVRPQPAWPGSQEMVFGKRETV